MGSKDVRKVWLEICRQKHAWVAELYRVDGRPSKRVMETLAWS